MFDNDRSRSPFIILELLTNKLMDTQVLFCDMVELLQFCSGLGHFLLLVLTAAPAECRHTCTCSSLFSCEFGDLAECWVFPVLNYKSGSKINHGRQPTSIPFIIFLCLRRFYLFHFGNTPYMYPLASSLCLNKN